VKAIVIGRHELIGDEGLEVLQQRNINFPATSGDCRIVVFDLLQDAIADSAVLVFQMMPAQLAIACSHIIGQDPRYKIGAIVNKPGERPAAKELATEAHQGIEEAVKFVNPRAKIDHQDGVMVITVDPPLRFEFSHIEWF